MKIIINTRPRWRRGHRGRRRKGFQYIYLSRSEVFFGTTTTITIMSVSSVGRNIGLDLTKNEKFPHQPEAWGMWRPPFPQNMTSSAPHTTLEHFAHKKGWKAKSIEKWSHGIRGPADDSILRWQWTASVMGKRITCIDSVQFIAFTGGTSAQFVCFSDTSNSTCSANRFFPAPLTSKRFEIEIVPLRWLLQVLCLARVTAFYFGFSDRIERWNGVIYRTWPVYCSARRPPTQIKRSRHQSEQYRGYMCHLIWLIEL